MSTAASPLTALAEHPRRDDLGRLVHALAFAAFDERRASLGEGLAEAMDQLGLAAADLETAGGHVGGAIEAGAAAGRDARALVGALLASGVSLAAPSSAEAEARVAEGLLWLAAQGLVDALPHLDRALGGKAVGLWRAIAVLVRDADEGRAPLVGRAGALLGAAALGQSASPTAKQEASALAERVADPVVAQLLRGAPSGAGAAAADGVAAAAGEMGPAPHHPIAFALLAMTGLLFVARAARLAGRLIVRYRAPTEVRVAAGGVTVKTRTMMLGRTLREREIHIPKESLLVASREVRYPRLGLYAGLFALALGSYVGVSVFVDGVRAGSPDLLGVGALIFGLGVALDFGFSYLIPAQRGRCRVLFVPRRGRAVAIDDLEPAQADAALARLRA